MSKIPSPCIDVCKFKRKGHCIGCDLGTLNRQVVGDDVAMPVGDRGKCRERGVQGFLILLQVLDHRLRINLALAFLDRATAEEVGVTAFGMGIREVLIAPRSVLSAETF